LCVPVVFEQTCRSASACAVVAVATNVPAAASSATPPTLMSILVRLVPRGLRWSRASFISVLPPLAAGGEARPDTARRGHHCQGRPRVASHHAAGLAGRARDDPRPGMRGGNGSK
jgi:hypothetical protein